MKPTALLLNPPGSYKYLRDCYCSHVNKANYYWHPLDLLIQSGFLGRDYEVLLIDAIQERIDPQVTMDRLLEARPDLILSLTSSLSWHEDRHFFERVKEETGALMVVSGDLPRFQSVSLLKRAPFLDGVLLDLTTPDLAPWFASGGALEGSSITARKNGRVVEGTVEGLQQFSYPIPRHDLFLCRDYRFPFGLPLPYASILATHGCPYRCSFCNAGMLHLTFREWDNLAEELAWINREGIRGLQVREANFNMSKGYVQRFCDHLLSKSYSFQWFCNGRADTLDEDSIALMARAGCRFAAFGIESGDQAILDIHKERANLAKAVRTLKVCRTHGIETLGHFVIGLPEDTHETLDRTRRLLRRIPLDFATVSIFEPRPGALLFGEEITVEFAEGYDPATLLADSEYSPAFSPGEVRAMQRRLYHAFYFRFSFIARRLSRLRSWNVFRSYLRNGWSLLRSFL